MTLLEFLQQSNVILLEGDQTIFDMGPKEFAQGVSACIAAGATVVGGCCGTSPAHIQAVTSALGRS